MPVHTAGCADPRGTAPPFVVRRETGWMRTDPHAMEIERKRGRGQVQELVRRPAESVPGLRRRGSIPGAVPGAGAAASLVSSSRRLDSGTRVCVGWAHTDRAQGMSAQILKAVLQQAIQFAMKEEIAMLTLRLYVLFASTRTAKA